MITKQGGRHMARTFKPQVAWGDPALGINYFPANMDISSPNPVLIIGGVDNYIQGTDPNQAVKIDPSDTVYSMQRFFRVWFLEDDDTEILDIKITFDVPFTSEEAKNTYSFYAGLVTPTEYHSGQKKPVKTAPNTSYMKCFAGADRNPADPELLVSNVYSQNVYDEDGVTVIGKKYYSDYIVLQSKYDKCTMTNPTGDISIIIVSSELV